jgi:hypothetical protein
MSIQESSATVLVRFTGLGIVCFNSERQRGEVAAVRDQNHELSISIQQPAFVDDAAQDVITYQDIATYTQLPKEGVSVEIKAVGPSAVPGYEIYQSGDFDRQGSADPNDFRWLVNLNELHAGGTLVPTGGDRYPLTKIYIGNGLFYTHKLDQNLLFERVEKDAAGVAGQRETFGNVGETMGVKIDGEEVAITIRIGDREETHTLKRIDGLPFRIQIKNMDYRDNAVYSDMADYYKYMSSPTGNQVELSPVLDDASGRAVNQQDFCHPIIVGINSIDEL